jgi:flagellar biosynthetic protein FliR/type III secretion protein T
VSWSVAQVIALLWPHALAVAACAARLSPVAMLCPLLGGQASGQMVKLSTCLALALGVHFAGGVEAPALEGAWAVAGLLGREAVFGVAIGLVVGLPFDAARIGGRFIDTFRGTSAEASLPFAGSREAASGDALYQLVLALAISGGGASIAISGALRSFGAVRLGAFVPAEAVALQLAGLAGGALATGFAVGAPIAGCALAVDAVLGLASRAASPVSVSDLGPPLRILLGGAVLWLSVGVLCERLLAGVAASGLSLDALYGALR